MSATAALPKRTVSVQIPSKFRFLFEMHPYKVAYGGRHGLKTRSFASALVLMGANQPLRILCAREIQRSIKDSVHKELSDAIQRLELGQFYEVLETEIRGANGTEIIFTGLSGHTIESVKSYAGIDVVWVEEAQSVRKVSWDILLPTIRAPNSEIWVSFNPDMDTDDTWQRFIVNPPPGTVCVKTGWQDAAEQGWFPENENQKRLHCKKTQPDDYDNIYEGKCRSSVAGAVYGREVAAMMDEGRFRPVPYDPRFPVHTIWDLGWNDAMATIFVQKVAPSVLNVINYMEDSFKKYSEWVADMDRLGYRWGTDWLPHDGDNTEGPTSGSSAKQTLRALGRRKIRIIGRGDPDEQIRMARMMFPRVYIDNSTRARETGYLGGARLLECLRRLRRAIPTSTGEPGRVVHDQYSHGGDAWRGLATIVDQIKNDSDVAFERLPGFSNPDPGMGMLR